MLKTWYYGGGDKIVIVKLNKTDAAAFKRYLEYEAATQTANAHYIQLLDLTNPQVACTVSESLLKALS